MNKFKNYRFALMGTACFALAAASSFAKSSKDQLFEVDPWSVGKAVCHKTYDAFLRDEYLKAAKPVKEYAVVKFKQRLWREGDLAALQNDGTFIPVVHQYRNLADWALSFVFGSKERAAINYGAKALNWMYDLEGSLNNALIGKYGVSTPEEFIGLAAAKIVGNLVQSASEPYPAPSPSDALSVGQLHNLKADLSTQVDRAEQLGPSYEKWETKDWVSHVLYILSEKMNEQAESIIDSLQASLKDAYFNAQEDYLQKAAAAVGGSVVGMMTANPWAAVVAGGAIREAQLTLPQSILERQKELFDANLNRMRENNWTLFSLTEDDVRKHDNKVLKTSTDEEFDLEVIDIQAVQVPSLSQYLKNLSLNAISSAATSFVSVRSEGNKLGTPYKTRDAILVDALSDLGNNTVAAVSSGANTLNGAYHEGADKRVGNKLGTPYKKRDAILVGSLNALGKGTISAVSGGANLLKSGAGKVFGWFK